MTIKDLIDFWKNLSLAHKDINQANVGSYYDAATNTDDRYPLAFIEMPFTINYSQPYSKRLDQVQFSFSIFLSSKPDSIVDDYEAISFAKSIGDAIITMAGLIQKDFIITSVNAISVREYTDDLVAGLRYDLVLSIIRDICEEDINDYFNLDQIII